MYDEPNRWTITVEIPARVTDCPICGEQVSFTGVLDDCDTAYARNLVMNAVHNPPHGQPPFAPVEQLQRYAAALIALVASRQDSALADHVKGHTAQDIIAAIRRPPVEPDVVPEGEPTYDLTRDLNVETTIDVEAGHVVLPSGDTIHMPAVMVTAGLAPNTNAARRLIKHGHVAVNGARLFDHDQARIWLVGHLLTTGTRSVLMINPPF